MSIHTHATRNDTASEVLASGTLHCGDNLAWLKSLPTGCADLVFTSPPYVDCRTYGIGFKLTGQAWVDWAVERYIECVRVSRGLVAWVVEGKTKRFRWDATPALLMADLHRRGVKLRKPPIYKRDGIPGSGGPEWLKNKYEFIVCASHGRLPWSENTAMGHPPRFAPGGALSHRHADGRRKNSYASAACQNRMGGTHSHDGRTYGPRLQREGDVRRVPQYAPPKNANPGNIIDCGPGGGGHMGSRLAHENEAPFPEKLAEFFIRSFSPPGGLVIDPHMGSGTVAAVAERHGRGWAGCDVRESQIELARRRVEEVKASRQEATIGA